jgi:hypothetical protein
MSFHPAGPCTDGDCDYCERQAEAVSYERNERASEQACADRADREARWDR